MAAATEFTTTIHIDVQGLEKAKAAIAELRHLEAGLGEPEAEFSMGAFEVSCFNLGEEMRGFPMSEMWMVDEGAAIAAMDYVKEFGPAHIAAARASSSPEPGAQPTRVAWAVKDGVAYLPVTGILTKRPQSMAMGSSYLQLRQSLRGMLKEYRAGSIKDAVLVIDSPGGEANGAFDLADDIYNIGQEMPIYSYCQDETMSGGLLISSQTRKRFANPSIHAGSLGVFTMVADTTKALKDKGVKMYVFKSGKYKAIGAPGQPVDKEQQAYMQARVDQIMSMFVQAVHRGMGLSEDQIAAIADAQVFIGEEAVAHGIVDQIATIDEAHSAIVSGRASTARPGKEGAAMAVDKSKVQTWLRGVTGRGVEATPEPDERMQVSDEALEALQVMSEAKIDNASALRLRLAMAEVGDKATARLRSRVAALKVIALGTKAEPGTVEESLSAFNYDGLLELQDNFTSIGVAKGVLTEGGEPAQRRSAGSGSHAPNGTQPVAATVEVADKADAIKASEQMLRETKELHYSM